MTYKPTYIKAYETGLVQSRQNFILPNDAYPVLENAFVWRERIKRKQGYELLGRLRRLLETQSLGNTDGAGAFSGSIRSILSLETNATIQPGSVEVTIGAQVFTEPATPDGTLSNGASGTGTVNYATMAITIQTSPVLATTAITANFNYYPMLPVMGLRKRELNAINNEDLVAWDTKYAYRYSGGWQEFLPGTTWTGTDSDFFWTTNYWIGDNNRKIFWATNFTGSSGDPIRYTNGIAGTNWIGFAPAIDNAGTPNRLQQCLALVPFRGRLVAFNTFEGTALAGSTQFRQRIRWAQIGNPFADASAIVTTVVAEAWRDDIPGKGGFLDIPTNEDIVSVGFVRDNLVIFCESSTWQLRYTGRSIAPFQIEKVNTELGAESTFSAVQFDTSLVGIGDKGVVECDSFKSDRIDIKIPDLIYEFNNNNNGTKRVHGIRDFPQRLAYWTYPLASTGAKFPDRRLVYNYENQSWAIFTDSLTTLGTFQPVTSPTWASVTEPWQNQNYPWVIRPAGFPAIVGGNQQGYVLYLDAQVSNDESLTITNITGNTTTATTLTIPDHNLNSGAVIEINDIIAGSPFASSLNGNKFGVVKKTDNTIDLYTYNTSTEDFTDPQLDAPATYIGGGNVRIRDNFLIVSKKFNNLDTGQVTQLGYIDVLMSATSEGEVTLNIYNDYNDTTPVNIYPQNATRDTFFNSVVQTSATGSTSIGSEKYWHRVFCATRSAFITLEWTLSKAQLISNAQESNVQIDAQILYMRPAGNELPIGV